MSVQPTDETLPLIYDFDLYQGDTKRITVIVSDNNDDEMSLTGCVLIAHIKYSRAIDAVLIDMHATAAADQVANKGQLTLTINPADYALVPNVADDMDLGVWDLQITWPSGDRITYLTGAVTLKGDVS